MEITNEEIEYAASILLSDKNAFYDGDKSLKKGERADVIKSLQSKNIVACPGSGKTTTLLAKLVILANKMPFSDGRGICVFTHTNVAIDQIKKELGSKSDVLFSYPNFFGTIQSFVNRFLATLSFVEKKGFRPTIDNDQYYKAVKRSYENSGQISKAKPWIQNQTSYSLIEPHVFLGHMRFKFGDSGVVAKDLFKDPIMDQTKDSYIAIKAFKEMIYDYGYLPYDEAYTEAYDFITCNPKVVEAISARFKFVFADEMQDSGLHQVSILEALFKDKRHVVYQCFGDPNQAIFDSGRAAGLWTPDSSNSLLISDTKRFSDSISAVINTLRINYHKEYKTISSSSINSSQAPHLIVFKEEHVEQVITKYAEIIASAGLSADGSFYAVGRIVKEPDKGRFSIKSYYKDFEKRWSNNNENYSELQQYFTFNNTVSSIKAQRDRVLDSILFLLEKNRIRNSSTKRRFTKRTLLNFIREYDEDEYFNLKSKIADWIKKVATSDEGFAAIKDNIVSYYQALFDKVWSIELEDNNSFFSISTNNPDDSVEEKGNIIECVINMGNGDINIPIAINTVNGEKGKTHTATLYLETFKNTYDVEKVISYLAGAQIKIRKRGANAGEIVSTSPVTHLKFTYVGMSRPTHLLCVAVRETVVNTDLRTRLISNGWVINDDLAAASQ